MQSKNPAGWESEDDEKLLFCNEPSEKIVKIKKTTPQTQFLLKDDWKISLPLHDLKIKKDTGQYQKDELKIESEAKKYNLNYNIRGLSIDRALGIEKCHKLETGSRHSMIDCLSQSVQEESDSRVLTKNRILLSNTSLNYSSDRMKLPLPYSKSLCAHHKTSQSADSNLIRLTGAKNTMTVLISTSDTPVSDDSKTPSKFYTFDYPISGRDNDSEKFSFSTNSQSSELRSITDSSTLKEPLSVSARSLPLMKNVRGPKSGGRRSSLNTPVRPMAFAFPSSLRERKESLERGQSNTRIKKSMKKRKPKKLRRSRKPYEFLTTGTPLLKYCRRKPPHWRHFEVDTDLEYLVWYSDTKPIKQTRISLADIDDVIFGQVSPGFQRTPRSRLFHQSFSIKYQGKNYLDLICVTYRDCQMWYHSLKNVIKNIRDGNKWLRMREIDIPNKPEKSKNAIYPARDGKTWEKYLTLLHRSQDNIRQLLKRSEELLESSGVLTMRKRLKKQIRQLDTWAEDAKTSEYLLLTQYDELRVIRVEIRVLQYKVACLLREKASKGTILSNIFHFGSTSTPESSITNYIVPLATEPRKSRSGPMNHTTHSHRRVTSDPLQMQPLATDEKMQTILPEKRRRRRSERAALVPPRWYKRMPRYKKSLVREMMVNDVIKETLSDYTVSQMCFTFNVTREEVEAIARYLDEKYKISKIKKLITVERSGVNTGERSRSVPQIHEVLPISATSPYL